MFKRILPAIGSSELSMVMGVVLAVVLSVGGSFAHAQTYKWVDEKGVIHYSDEPLPAKVEAPPPKAEFPKPKAASPKVKDESPQVNVKTPIPDTKQKPVIKPAGPRRAAGEP